MDCAGPRAKAMLPGVVFALSYVVISEYKEKINCRS
jgi:hypothetical protein